MAAPFYTRLQGLAALPSPLRLPLCARGLNLPSFVSRALLQRKRPRRHVFRQHRHPRELGLQPRRRLRGRGRRPLLQRRRVRSAAHPSDHGLGRAAGPPGVVPGGLGLRHLLAVHVGSHLRRGQRGGLAERRRRLHELVHHHDGGLQRDQLHLLHVHGTVDPAGVLVPLGLHGFQHRQRLSLFNLLGRIAGDFLHE